MFFFYGVYQAINMNQAKKDYVLANIDNIYPHLISKAELLLGWIG
jgi:hypothetical protein